MPSIKGKPKEQISYKCPHDLFQRINELIDGGEYASRNDIITAALRSFFADPDKLINEHIKEWVTSEEGRMWLKEEIRRVLREEKPRFPA